MRDSGTEITAKHPRWIGAWWLGFVICSVINFMLFIPMMMLPKNMKPIKDTSKEAQEIMKASINCKGSKAADSKLAEADDGDTPTAKLRFSGVRGR